MARTFDTTNKVQVLLKIKDPDDDDNFVWIPVTVQVTFMDPKTVSQEYSIVFDLSDKSGRVVHVKELRPKTGDPDDYETDDSATPLKVERIDRLGVADAKTDSQGYGFRFKVLDEPNTWPTPPELLETYPFNRMHRVVRYTKDNKLDGEPWVDVELKEFLMVTDPKTDSQEYVYRVAYAEKGPPIGDDDDPYRPTFAGVNPSLERFTQDLPVDENGKQIVRTSMLENIVNFSFANAIELQPDQPTMATVVLDATQIADSSKFLFSGYFQFPHGAGLPFSDGSWLLLEFGGGPINGSLGSPETSKIEIVQSINEAFVSEYFVQAGFVGGTQDMDWDLGNTFWGFSANLIDPLMGGSAVTHAAVSRAIFGTVKIGNEEKMQQSLEKWHHLAVTFDLTTGDWDEDNPLEIFYEWVPVSEARFMTAGAIEAYNGPLRDFLLSRGLDADPLNTIYSSPVADMRGSPHPQGFGHFNKFLLPSAQEHPRERWYALSQGGGPVFFTYMNPAAGSDYIGHEFVSWPSVRVKSQIFTAPMKMTLDRKTPMDSDVTGSSSLGSIIFRIQESYVADEKDWVVVKGRQFAVPRKSSDKVIPEGPLTQRMDLPTRLAIYQIWLSTSADIYDVGIKDRLTTQFLDPKDGKTYIKPAALTAADTAGGATPLSHAAALFGKPDVFMKGNKGTQDPAKPPGVTIGGFPKNRGSAAGDFVKKNVIENFSPPPNKILLPP